MDLIGLYPTWYEPGIGSGYVIAIIATIHVLFSHTAVGAALLFTYLAYLGYRDDRPELIDFIKKYGMFLLVFSYILGSITGPGIWYSTTVGSPRGISALIHNFVWKWATEWVFFVIEVVGVYMMVYLVGKVDKATYLRIAITFGLASFATMLAIVGILSFMMEPGMPEWTEKGGYLLGFYGDNTFAQLAIRSMFMLTITAVVGGIVVAGLKDQVFKTWLARRLAVLGIVTATIGMLLYPWYLSTLPAQAQIVMENRIPAYYSTAILSVLLATIAYFVFTLIKPRMLTASIAGFATLAILILGLFPGETIRESARKPYVAGEYLYSNQVIGKDVPGMTIKSEIPTLEKVGFTHASVFWPETQREITPQNAAEVGRSLAIAACSNCHSLSPTGIRPIASYFGGMTDIPRIQNYLIGALSTGNTMYMPKIPLKEKEAEALALYLASLADPTVVAKFVDEKTRAAEADAVKAAPSKPVAVSMANPLHTGSKE
ncbi:MAG: cytochrome C [Halothiobacillus sp. 24-54-40]|jgi:cytochrome bd-type quinol oxidase subunit 1/mono/diheme cytochrome c family protein|nr:cytochrome c [Halothiobacillaceae bacterium]OYV45464.1 MAG: cytochrome C [Halothiobacillus sp. 20-53-49]OYY43829.1 MAG: cytochrome C [Halothiobacillus sp. 35-54-62]OYY56216.1 MAG: cytochrome C [Halothiobacillus sp. 28-55-5]OYZ85979.1 MAG: cytochrome C [Halothiobacillus sp. 24-54-40]OZA79748.1 MAG: cytochrome C [Halothiobacillus sp. 39-53-45]HQS03782.1 cytochrome c [Halothiobacillus sp.]